MLKTQLVLIALMINSGMCGMELGVVTDLQDQSLLASLPGDIFDIVVHHTLHSSQSSDVESVANLSVTCKKMSDLLNSHNYHCARIVSGSNHFEESHSAYCLRIGSKRSRKIRTINNSFVDAINDEEGKEVAENALVSPYFMPNYEKKRRNPLINEICLMGYNNLLDLLLATKPSIGINSSGKAPIALCFTRLSMGHYMCIQKLLDAGFGINDSVNRNGDTILLLAAAQGYNPLVEIFLQKGAYVHVANRFGLKPLHMALEKSVGNLQPQECEKIVRTTQLLINAGADPLVKIPNLGKNSYDIVANKYFGKGQRFADFGKQLYGILDTHFTLKNN